MFKKILLVGVALILAFLGYAATLPDTLRIERSTLIQASPEKIAAEINDFHRWAAWSPYEKVDPNMKRRYMGANNGQGARYEWESKMLGMGSMEIQDTSPEKIVIKLDFIKPFETHNIAEFTLKPQGNSTQVTWSMQGPNPYLSRVLHLICNAEAMMGKNFEEGLASLKILAEK